MCVCVWFWIRVNFRFVVFSPFNQWIRREKETTTKKNPMKMYTLRLIILLDVATCDSHDVHNSISHSTVSTAYILKYRAIFDWQCLDINNEKLLDSYMKWIRSPFSFVCIYFFSSFYGWLNQIVVFLFLKDLLTWNKTCRHAHSFFSVDLNLENEFLRTIENKFWANKLYNFHSR